MVRCMVISMALVCLVMVRNWSGYAGHCFSGACYVITCRVCVCHVGWSSGLAWRAAATWVNKKPGQCLYPRH